MTLPAFLERFPQIDTINNSSGYNARLQGKIHHLWKLVVGGVLVTDERLGITMGTWNLGCFASAILTIFIGDYLGRRKTLLLGLAIWSIGEIVQCSSYSFGQFISGRFIAGFGKSSCIFCSSHRVASIRPGVWSEPDISSRISPLVVCASLRGC